MYSKKKVIVKRNSIVYLSKSTNFKKKYHINMFYYILIPNIIVFDVCGMAIENRKKNFFFITIKYIIFLDERKNQ